MAISNLTYKDYLWIKKENSNIYGIRLSKNNLPTDTAYIGDIPAVNNGTLIIQKNGTEIAKFTANSSTNQIANIIVPTKVSELKNDSNFTSNTGTITEIKVNGTSKGTSGSVNLTNIVTFASSQTANVAGTSKTTYRYNQPTGDSNTGNSNGSAYFPEGIIMGGTAASAGLVTRGICGVTTPDANTGACSKESLYINYDGSNTYQSNRQLVLQAGEIGKHYGNNLYQYAAARGDAVKGYCDATYAAKSHPHNYAASDTAGGPANSVKNKLKFGSQTYDGSAEKTITLTDLGAATVATSGNYNDLSNRPNIPNPTNYYWANVKISSSPSKTTTPIFDSVEIKEKCTVSYSAIADALEFIFK